ncbi:60S ribosomal protein L27 [Boothiomyces macroporosus]|uniref:60S ribosomal protein L27 n=1 Tax=Boothiomyces macroporosus TaxID=261099 RepID=A0AAD5UMU5_9FUNG|nr:60S ribosomal protein L27 [Boothiomyces macroporosus]
MVKFLQNGKVVLLLQGRQAGKKAVIVKSYEEGTKERRYPHAIVAGIERYPLKITKSMGKKKVAKRSKVKPFIKVVNFNHVMPTRYSIDVDVKQAVSADSFKEPTQRIAARKAIRKLFEERYNSGKNKWFFQKLRKILTNIQASKFIFKLDFLIM